MIKKNLSVIICLFIFTNTIYAQVVVFRKTFSNITITSVSQASDNGYIIAGYSTAYGMGSKDIILIKTDSMGVTQWSNTFGNNVNTNADDIPTNAVENTSGLGGYYLAGQFWNQTNGSYEVYVLKTDAAGKRIWSKTMYNGGYDKGKSVVNATGGGCIVTGWIGNSSKGYLCKLDSNGNIVWQNSVAYFTNAWVLEAGKETHDGGTISCGYDNEQGSYEMWLVKTNAPGSISWQKGYAMSGTYNFCYDVCQANDKGYLLAGGSSDLNLAKTDSNGIIVWAKSYSAGLGGPRAYSVKQCSDYGYIVLANDISNNQYLMKIDSTGSVQWTTKYAGGYFVNTVEQTKDGGYVLAMGSDIIKTDTNGITGCNETPFAMTASNLTLVTRTTAATATSQTASNNAADGSTTPAVTDSLPCPFLSVNEVEDSGIDFSVYPNPGSGKFYTWYDEPLKENFRIVNLNGTEISAIIKAEHIQNGKQWMIDCSLLNAGIYFLIAQSEQGLLFRKLVKY